MIDYLVLGAVWSVDVFLLAFAWYFRRESRREAWTNAQ